MTETTATTASEHLPGESLGSPTNPEHYTLSAMRARHWAKLMQTIESIESQPFSEVVWMAYEGARRDLSEIFKLRVTEIACDRRTAKAAKAQAKAYARAALKKESTP